jgi:hypothetical protein
MKPTFAKAIVLLVTIYVGSSLFSLVADEPVKPRQTFRRVLEIEIDKSSDFVRSGQRDKLSDEGQKAFDEMQERMALLLKSVVEFENAQK